MSFDLDFLSALLRVEKSISFELGPACVPHPHSRNTHTHTDTPRSPVAEQLEAQKQGWAGLGWAGLGLPLPKEILTLVLQI